MYSKFTDEHREYVTRRLYKKSGKDVGRAVKLFNEEYQGENLTITPVTVYSWWKKEGLKSKYDRGGIRRRTDLGEKNIIENALKARKNKLGETAKLLGISKCTLKLKCKQYGLEYLSSSAEENLGIPYEKLSNSSLIKRFGRDF